MDINDRKSKKNIRGNPNRTKVKQFRKCDAHLGTKTVSKRDVDLNAVFVPSIISRFIISTTLLIELAISIPCLLLTDSIFELIQWEFLFCGVGYLLCCFLVLSVECHFFKMETTIMRKHWPIFYLPMIFCEHVFSFSSLHTCPLARVLLYVVPNVVNYFFPKLECYFEDQYRIYVEYYRKHVSETDGFELKNDRYLEKSEMEKDINYYSKLKCWLILTMLNSESVVCRCFESSNFKNTDTDGDDNDDDNINVHENVDIHIRIDPDIRFAKVSTPSEEKCLCFKIVILKFHLFIILGISGMLELMVKCVQLVWLMMSSMFDGCIVFFCVFIDKCKDSFQKQNTVSEMVR